MLVLPATLYAQSPDPAKLAQVFTTYQHTNTPGCAVGVVAPGRDTWTAAYGMADLEHTIANTPATVFEAGSVSKQFTAADRDGLQRVLHSRSHTHSLVTVHK